MSNPSDLTDPRPPQANGSAGHGQGLPPVPDLPPVEAPSGAFIVQLFVIPAVVVLVVVLVWLLFGKLAGGERDAMEYVRLIRASSTNWRAANRAAYELASLIQNDKKLASDPRLVGELTELLDQQLNKPDDPEMSHYLALALGRFEPVEAVTSTGRKVDPLATLSRAVAGDYAQNVRLAAATSLAQQAARVEGRLDDPAVVEALAGAAQSGEPSLKQVATFALGFLGGDAAATALRQRLVDDDRDTRYNAAVALGRRDDPAALPVLREMLSSADLQKRFEGSPPGELEARTEAIELEALRALDTALERGKPTLARELRPQVETLTRSNLAEVRNTAQAVLKKLPGA